MDQMLHRMPIMEQAQVQQLINGPESFTPDGKCIMGEAPEVSGCKYTCTTSLLWQKIRMIYIENLQNTQQSNYMKTLLLIIKCVKGIYFLHFFM